MGKKRRGIRESSMEDVEYKSFTKKIKFENKKDIKYLAFPLLDKKGNVRVKEIDCFSVVDQGKLSDGKWHQFQLPESDEMYEKCKAHPLLKESTVRAVLVIVFDGDLTKVKKDIGYGFEYISLTKTRHEMIKELSEEVIDEGYNDIGEALIRAKLNTGENSLKMQTFGLQIKGDNPALKGKCTSTWREIQKEASEEWEKMNTTLVKIEEDDVLEVLLDTDEGEEGSRKKKSKKKSKKRDFRKKKKV
jgi:hypothetical protein